MAATATIFGGVHSEDQEHVGHSLCVDGQIFSASAELPFFGGRTIDVGTNSMKVLACYLFSVSDERRCDTVRCW